jgi:hypothetical protein
VCVRVLIHREGKRHSTENQVYFEIYGFMGVYKLSYRILYVLIYKVIQNGSVRNFFCLCLERGVVSTIYKYHGRYFFCFIL